MPADTVNEIRNMISSEVFKSFTYEKIADMSEAPLGVVHGVVASAAFNDPYMKERRAIKEKPNGQPDVLWLGEVEQFPTSWTDHEVIRATTDIVEGATIRALNQDTYDFNAFNETTQVFLRHTAQLDSMYKSLSELGAQKIADTAGCPISVVTTAYRHDRDLKTRMDRVAKSIFKMALIDAGVTHLNPAFYEAIYNIEDKTVEEHIARIKCLIKHQGCKPSNRL